MTSYFWIIGGGLLQVPLIEKVKSLGYKALVSDASPTCACAELADLFLEIDIFDIERHMEAADKLIESGDKISAVLAAGIDAPVTMSRLCEHLNLPGVASEISEVVHNKYLCRKKFQELGIEVPEFRQFHITELDQLTTYLDSMPTPFVIKNVDSSGSRGTKIFAQRDAEEELRIAKEACRVSRSDCCLVESVWVGQEVTVETLFNVRGVFFPCFITDRNFDYASGYPIETDLQSPSALPVGVQQQCFNLAFEVASKLGINIGAAKYDMIVTAQGPKIIEMTTRLSGGFDCQYLVPSASGKDVLMAAVQTALGIEFDEQLLTDTKHKVAVTGSLWPEQGTITAIDGVDQALTLTGVEHIFFRNKVGDRLEGYENCADRVCFIIATGADVNDAKSKLSMAMELISIQVQRD